LIRFALAAEGKTRLPVDGQPGLVFYKQAVDAPPAEFEPRLWPWTRSRTATPWAVLYDHAARGVSRWQPRTRPKDLWTQPWKRPTRKKSPSSDTKRVKVSAKEKLDALKNGPKEPAVAPLGQAWDDRPQRPEIT